LLSEGDGVAAAADCSEAMVEKVLRVWQKTGAARGAAVVDLVSGRRADGRQNRWGNLEA